MKITNLLIPFSELVNSFEMPARLNLEDIPETHWELKTRMYQAEFEDLPDLLSFPGKFYFPFQKWTSVRRASISSSSIRNSNYNHHAFNWKGYDRSLVPLMIKEVTRFLADRLVLLPKYKGEPVSPRCHWRVMYKNWWKDQRRKPELCRVHRWHIDREISPTGKLLQRLESHTLCQVPDGGGS